MRAVEYRGDFILKKCCDNLYVLKKLLSFGVKDIMGIGKPLVGVTVIPLDINGKMKIINCQYHT